MQQLSKLGSSAETSTAVCTAKWRLSTAHSQGSPAAMVNQGADATAPALLSDKSDMHVLAPQQHDRGAFSGRHLLQYRLETSFLHQVIARTSATANSEPWTVQGKHAVCDCMK